MKDYLTIEKEISQETVIKKSRFICTLYPVGSPEEAAAVLEAAKKQYWDARHNCSAYILGENSSLMRFSDDGEPQGTAGIPMLEVLKQSGLKNVLAVVTRYFGGVLLGAGGLVRAYSGAVSGAVHLAQKIKMVSCIVCRIAIPYASFGRLETMIAASGVYRGNIEYTEEIQAELLVPEERWAAFEDEVREAFFGSVLPQITGQTFQALRI